MRLHLHRIVYATIATVTVLFVDPRISNADPGDAPFKVDLPIAHVAEPFSTFMKTVDVDFSIRVQKCATAERATCTYELSGNLALIAIGEKENSLADEIMLIGAKDLDPFSWLIAMGAIIAIVDPDLNKDQRGELVKALMAAMNRGDEEGIDGQNARYKISISQSVGVFFFARSLGNN